FAGKKSAQIREILINESAWEEMTCLFALSLMRAEFWLSQRTVNHPAVPSVYAALSRHPCAL
ncbi:hypothetical protein M2X78_26995, partial [Klebsiella pneumoniae]|nr:hypothetical protein [Klebsiella pneumoniae]